MSLLLSGLVLPRDTDAQTVTTVGGGPRALPITQQGSAGSTDGLTFSVAQFNVPVSGDLDSDGTLFLVSQGDGAIRKITTPSATADSLTSTLATGLLTPVDLVVTAGNKLFVLTQADGALRRFSRTGTLEATLTTALTSPTCLTVDTKTNFYVGEAGGNVQKVTTGGVVTLVKNVGGSVGGVAMLDDNTIAVSVSGANNLQQILLSDSGTTLLAGSSAGTSGFADGLAGDSLFNNPGLMRVTPNGTLILADRGNHRYRTVSPGGTVGTLYGTDTSNWLNFPTANPALLPGWVDGDLSSAQANTPSGVVVLSDGTTLYTLEQGWNLVREVAGLSFSAADTGDGTTGDGGTGGANTNLTTSLLTFGFQSGAASSAFKATAGQTFIVPVTLTLVPDTTIYSLGFNIAATNLTNYGTGAVSPTLATAGSSLGFSSRLLKFHPDPNVSGKIVIPVGHVLSNFAVFTTNTTTTPATITTNIGAQIQSGINRFDSGNLRFMSVTWVETDQPESAVVTNTFFDIPHTNLYPVADQELISFSGAYDRSFNKDGGRVLLGALSVSIPGGAAINDSYAIQLLNASASKSLGDPTTTAHTESVPIAVTKTGSLTNGLINSLKHIVVTTTNYLVGDVSNWRWFNAGDFGDGVIAMDDVSATFDAAFYGALGPVGDLADAFDSADSTADHTSDKNDGVLDINDVTVTLRRAFDPFSAWFTRSPGAPTAPGTATPNLLEKPTFTVSSFPSLVANTVVGDGSETIQFVVGDAVAGGPGNVRVPIHVRITGGLLVRSLGFGVHVAGIKHPGLLSGNVTFEQVTSLLTSPTFMSNRGRAKIAVAWVDLAGIGSGLGDGLHHLGDLVVPVGDIEDFDSAFCVHLMNASGAGGGAGVIHRRSNGLITFRDRSSSSLGDGIPDSWRLRHFGDLDGSLAQAEADADGDGMSNYEEFLAGTNPNDLLDRLGLGEVVVSEEIRLRWPTVPGRNYVLESSATLFSDHWSQVSPVVVGNGASAEFVDPDPNPRVRFYRVRVLEDSAPQ